MAELAHQWGSDLQFGSSGDLAIVTGSIYGQQRVLRRLLTNPIDYIWQPTYGAGLAGFIGKPANILQIRATIRSQMSKEPTVSQNPEPSVSVTPCPAGMADDIYVNVLYADANTGETQALTFSVGE
jgi:hypothetical protein